MLAVLRAALSVCVARFGDSTYRQVHGLPIGGPLSDLGPGLLLGLQEASWRALPGLRRLQSFDFADSSACRSAVALIRYVDDVIGVSRQICCSCLESLILGIHLGVPFASEHRSDEHPLLWLDVVVHARRWPIHVAMASPERPWLLLQAELPTKFRLQPWLGPGHCDQDAVRGHVRGRLSRWGQVRLAHAELVRAVLYDVLLFLRSGYPLRFVSAAWRKHSSDHSLAHLIRPLLGHIVSLHNRRG